ncbi:hypothetical protein TNCV_622031 [Trichonephila clavipes]|nr:hypothetical protein TNCV_622031 [Trichonephila clavipes]
MFLLPTSWFNSRGIVEATLFTSGNCALKSRELFTASLRTQSCGCGSLVVKATDSCRACHKFESNTAEDPPCKSAMQVKSVDAQTSSCWCGG